MVYRVKGEGRRQAERGCRLGGGAWGPRALPVRDPKGETAVCTERGKRPAALGVDSTPFPSRDQLKNRLSDALPCGAAGRGRRAPDRGFLPRRRSHVLLLQSQGMKAAPRSFI